MKTHIFKNLLIFCVIAAGMTARLVPAQDGTSEKYVFRYKFRPNDLLQWTVVSRVDQLSTRGSHRDNTETNSVSTKNWKVLEVDANGTAILEYSIRDVDMKSHSSFENVESSYNSETDNPPPVEYLDVAELIGLPIAHFTINAKGEIVKRSQKAKVAATMQFAETAEENRITIPFPEHALGVGDAWNYSREIILPQPGGTVRKVAVRERYTFEKIQNGIATFGFRTDVLEPLDKDSEWALRTKIRDGTIQFDMIEGRSIFQQYDVKRTALGTLPGGVSATYRSRFVEKYLREE